MKQRLLDDGIALMQRFCEVNSLAVPQVNVRSTAEVGEVLRQRATSQQRQLESFELGCLDCTGRTA